MNELVNRYDNSALLHHGAYLADGPHLDIALLCLTDFLAMKLIRDRLGNHFKLVAARAQTYYTFEPIE